MNIGPELQRVRDAQKVRREQIARDRSSGMTLKQLSEKYKRSPARLRQICAKVEREIQRSFSSQGSVEGQTSGEACQPGETGKSIMRNT